MEYVIVHLIISHLIIDLFLMYYPEHQEFILANPDDNNLKRSKNSHTTY